MAANSGTPTTIQSLISGASAFTPVAPSDLIRYAIVQLNNNLAGLTSNAAPTLQQIETAASSLDQLQSDKMLNAILLQLIIGLLGGTTGRSAVLYGAGVPNGTAFGTVGDVYVDTAAVVFTPRFYVKTSGNGTNTGWST